MSFLLPDPGKPTRRNTNNSSSNRNNNNNNNTNNHGGGGVARLSMRSNSNYSATGSSSFIGGDNTTIVPRPRNNASLLNRGGGGGGRNQNQNQSQQQISGNQIMLQRQKPTEQRQKQKQKQQLQHRQQQQQQQPVKQQEQEQENLLGTSMEDIMKDIAILEQQQRDAHRKLESAKTTKQSKLNQQRQLNALLEKKKYSNGALCAKRQQCRDFLSGATRDLGSCKLGTDRFQGEIGDFNDMLNKGIRSAKMIEVYNAKIDSFINLTEHKLSKISRLKREKMDKTKKARMKYEQTEKEDRMLRSAIQDTHKKAREWAEEKASLHAEISKLDSDKMSAQNIEQSTDLRVQSACDQIKSEEDRSVQVKAIQLKEIDETVKQKVIIRSEIGSMSDSIQTLKLDLQAQKENIIECQKVEDGHPITSSSSTDDEDYVPVFDQNFFRTDLTKLEAVSKKEDDALNALNRSIEEMERSLQESEEGTLKNEEETTLLNSFAKSMSEEEENRRGDAVKFQTIIETNRAEVAKLKDSFREMEEIREAGVQTHCKAMADGDAEISRYTDLIEDLKLKIKREDTTLKTRIRLFQEEEKPKLLAALKAAEKGSRCAEKKHQDLIEMTTEASIESKLQAEFEFEKKFNDEKMKWEAKVRNIVAKRDAILEEFPELQDIEYTFDRNEDTKKQIDLALSDLKKDCSDRVAAANAIKGRKMKKKKERQLQSEAAKAKLKRKEEAKAKLMRSQLREEASCRANDLEGGSIEDSTPPRVQHGKGSDFFDPRRDDKTDDLSDETPSHPRKLISSFSQSQSSSGDKRVRWGDDVEVEDDCRLAEEEHVESRFEGDGELSENRHDKGKPTKTTKVAQYSKPILKDVNVKTNSNEESSRSSKIQIDAFEAKKESSAEEEGDLKKKTADSGSAFTEDHGSKKTNHRRRSSNRSSKSNYEKQDKVGELRKKLTISSRITREDESLDGVSSENDNDVNKNSHKRSRSRSSSRDEDRDRRAKQRKKSDNSARDSSSLYASTKSATATGSRGEDKKSSSSSLRGRKLSDRSLSSKGTNATAIQKCRKSSSSSSSSTRRNHNSKDDKSGRGSELAGKVPPKDKGQRQKSRSSRSIDKDPRKEGKDSSTDDRYESSLVKASSSQIKDRDETKTNIGSKAPRRTSRESRRERSSDSIRDDASLKSVSSRGKSVKRRSSSISSRSKETGKESREKRRDSDDASVKSVSSRGRGEKKRSNSSSSSIRSKRTEKESRGKRSDSDDTSVKSASSKGRVEKKRSSSSNRGIEKESCEKRRGSDDASVRSVSSKGRVEKKRSQSREKQRDGASVKSVSLKDKTGGSNSRNSSSSSSKSTGKESREKRRDIDDASIKSVSSKGKAVKSKSRSSSSSNSSKSTDKVSREKQHDGVRDDASVKSISSKGKTVKSKSRSSSNISKSTDNVCRGKKRGNSTSSVIDATAAKDKSNRTESDKSTGVRKESRGKGREKPSSSGARKSSSIRGDVAKTHQSLKARTSSQENEASKKRKVNEDSTSVSTSTTTATTNARRRKRRGTLSQKSTTKNMTDDAGFNF